MLGGWSPWRALRASVHVVVEWRRLDGRLGETDGQTIWLDPGQLQVERRCTLAHELEHVARGHTACVGPFEEARVHQAAARKLLPDIAMVADALSWAHGDLAEAAEELWVDVVTLQARLDGVNASEGRLLERRREANGPA